MNKENIIVGNFKYRSKLFLKSTHQLINKNQVGLFLPGLLIKFYYPIDKATERVKSHLINGIPLSKEFEKIRKELYQATDENPYFIHSLLTHWYLDDRITNLCDGNYAAIGSVKKIPLMTYVSAYGQENIFFVIDGGDENGNEKGILRCIEVHKRKPITYRTVCLFTTQVTKTKRITCGVSDLTIDELVWLSKPEINKRLKEIEIAKAAFKEKYPDDEGEG